MKTGPHILFSVSLLTFVFSIFAILYSLGAGIWGFNPTNIDWFNTKLLLTSIAVLIVSTVTTKITAHLN